MITRLRNSALALPIILIAFTIHIAVTTFCCLPSTDADGWNATFLCLNSASDDGASGDIADPHAAHEWCGCILACGGHLSPPLSPALLVEPSGEQFHFPALVDSGPPESRPTSFFQSRGPPALSV